LHVLGLGDVDDARRSTTAPLPDLLCYGVDAFAAARCEDDGGAAPGEQAGRGFADAAARSGDGDDLAVKREHYCLQVKWTRVRCLTHSTGHVSTCRSGTSGEASWARQHAVRTRSGTGPESLRLPARPSPSPATSTSTRSPS